MMNAGDGAAAAAAMVVRSDTTHIERAGREVGNRGSLVLGRWAGGGGSVVVEESRAVDLAVPVAACVSLSLARLDAWLVDLGR
jgi:hypothetical protein